MSSGEALESTTPGLGLTSRVASRLAWSLAALAVALCGLAVFASLVSLVEESLDRAGEAEAGAWLGSWTWVPLVLVPLAFLPVSFPARAASLAPLAGSSLVRWDRGGGLRVLSGLRRGAAP